MKVRITSGNMYLFKVAIEGNKIMEIGYENGYMLVKYFKGVKEVDEVEDSYKCSHEEFVATIGTVVLSNYEGHLDQPTYKLTVKEIESIIDSVANLASKEVA